MISKKPLLSRLFTGLYPVIVLLLCTCAQASAQDDPGIGSAGDGASPQLISTAVLSGAAIFEYNSYQLTPAAVGALNKLINDLDGFVAIDSVKVIGHTDDKGSEKYNRELSSKRARYIAHFFAKRFPHLNVISVGAGESSPVASNDTAAGRQRNRRVEIQVLARGVKP
ncbi:MAG: OmpA family protein [Gammaproteobacteria bacterium]|nr:OmpA family protein [Gammaproteobacteria bacterium]